MQLAWLASLGLVISATSLQLHATEGHSKGYTQCMNAATGQVTKLEKCIQKELKYHHKRLTKSYKLYLKANSNNSDVIQAQHKQWLGHLNQQCANSDKIKGPYAQVQEGQCRLSMSIVQANRYEAKNFKVEK